MDWTPQTIGAMTGVLVPLGAFALTALLVGMDQIAKHRARELRHQTIRFMVEKGQPIPPELMEEPKKRASPPGNDLGKGLKLLFAGIGISLFLYFAHQREWAVGLIPALLGVGYLISHRLSPRQPAQPPASP